MFGFQRLYDASRVKRYHTVDTIQEQTLAQHSWGVAMIVAAITPNEHPRKAQLIEYALTHDLHEVDTGDAPATAKWKYGKLNEFLNETANIFDRLHHLGQFDGLSPPERKIIKWADMLELVLWCKKEMDMGNRRISTVFQNGMNWIDVNPPPTSEARELYHDLLI